MYVGTNGISCGSGFIAHGNGSCIISGEVTAKGSINLIGGVWNGMSTGRPTFDADGIEASFRACSWRYATSNMGGNAGQVLGIKFDTPIYSPRLCTGKLSITEKSICADATKNFMKEHYEVLYFDDNGKAHFPCGISGYAADSHEHNYLPLSGGTITGDTYFKARMHTHSLVPEEDATYPLGSPDFKYSTVYSKNFVENGTSLSSKYVTKEVYEEKIHKLEDSIMELQIEVARLTRIVNNLSV